MNAAFDDTTTRPRNTKRLLALTAILVLTLAGLSATPASAKQAVPFTSSVSGTLPATFDAPLP